MNSEREHQRSMLTIRRLDSGYWHIRGDGPCNWAQPPSWPCDEETLRAHAFPEACEDFIRAVLDAGSSGSEAGPTAIKAPT